MTSIRVAYDVRGTPVWDVGPAPELARLEGDVEVDVCVVGLGGSGLACVGELVRLGARVAGVEAGRVGGGAAGRNGGFLLAGLALFYHDAVARYGRETARAPHVGQDGAACENTPRFFYFGCAGDFS